MLRKVKFPYLAHERPVQSGLAYSPSQMMESALAGVPISTANVDAQFLSSSPDNGYDSLPFESRRGVDLNDCWSEELRIKGKIRNGHREDIRLYGLNPQPVASV